MTSLLEPITPRSKTTLSREAYHSIRPHHCRNGLKSKKHGNKCRKVLKRKLKKYKLRHDGSEDQDIIDVSNILLSSLLIRSPNKINDRQLEELKPKNYLFKMVRRKQTLATTKSCQSTDVHTDTSVNKNVQMSPVTEEKKETNAFKLLMDSRNKSIGCNSPGKEKPIDEIDIQEFIEKKSIKVKRNLLLQRMAEEKGSLKKKEIDEQHEKYIKKKMEKRAEKLKVMIMNKEPKTVKEDKQKNLQIGDSTLDNIGTEKNRKVNDKPHQTLQLVSIFNNPIDMKISPQKKLIPNEDEEFLKKLSPSLRKKESMLSYFKKVDKDSDSNYDNSENDNVIKVKLGLKSKKRGRKKKLSLKRDTEILCDVPEIDSVQNHTESKHVEIIETTKNETNSFENLNSVSLENGIKERQKRKRKDEDRACRETPMNILIPKSADKIRPKRNVKRPVKYNDDVALSSSDEEIQILTPNKKKRSEYNSISKACIDLTTIETNVVVIKTSEDKREKNLTKLKKPVKDTSPPMPVKLAPIFKKSQPDPVAVEAKQKFLHSGVPEQLKKLIPKQKDHNALANTFLEVVHVQQLDKSLVASPALSYRDEIDSEDISQIKAENIFSHMLNLLTPRKDISMHLKNNISTQTILQSLKETHPKFPVHRTYKLLRGKKKGEIKACNIFSNLDNSVEILNCSIDMQNDNPDQLTWCDKYKPLSGNEIIGNFESIKELKKWLVTWTENDSKMKANDSDSSDYYQSEPDSRDSMKSNNNLLILSGPVGCGKTSCVYAIAAELSMKVIEVNASSKRTGKIMLQDLQEATQSHKVNRGTGSSENSQKSQNTVEIPPEATVKKRGRPKKLLEPDKPQKPLKTKQRPDFTNVISASQESTRTAMSLILIDDADIIFDQDDGFCSAIVQLVQSSKRPVILITGSLSCSHLQRFLQSSKILKFRPLLPHILGTWLDLMCLADCGTCWPGLGAKFLNLFKGDIRKTINCLQFYLSSQEYALCATGESQFDSQNKDNMKLNGDDENSCMSWADRDTVDDKNVNDPCDILAQSVWESIMDEHIHIKHMECALRFFNVWWNVPKILNIETNLTIEDQLNNVEKDPKNMLSLESISNVLETISICDYFSCIRPDTEANMTSHPWYDAGCSSVSEMENFDYYERKHETSNELYYELVKGSISSAQEKLGLESRLIIETPGMTAKRQRDRIVSRHINLTSYLNPQSTLDRKAVALDYWSACRTICRIEKSKTDSNSKRNNRFCHYLKSLNFLCKGDSFDSLANSLRPSGNTE